MGTWLGVNESGLVVAVTNRRDGELRWEDQIRSRGLLVIALLGLDDPSKPLVSPSTRSPRAASEAVIF